MHRFITSVAACALGVSVIGCGDGSRQGEGPAPGGPVTFTRDVAPVIHANCTGCHRPGESAPFSLITYEDVRRRARTIVDVVERRYMPPWLPAAGHGVFAGERRLTDAEIDTIRRWEEQGSVEGDAAALPPLPAFPEGWQLGEPDLIVRLPQPYTLQPEGGDVWRNFVIPVTVERTRYVRTIELRPGSARFVHHALVGVDTTRASRRRDGQDAEPGFGGMEMGDAQAPSGHLLGWTPGMAPFPGVEGKAWPLEPGTDFVVQLHLLPSGKPETVDPVVGVYFADRPPSPPAMSLVRLDADHLLDIPAGAKRFVVSDAFELPVDVDVLAIYPHAHYLASVMEGSARLPDGTVRPLIRIESWDFKWQDVYRYAQPLFLPRGSTISMRFSYDNSADNPRNPHDPPRRVVAGLASSDEMAHLQLQVLPRRAEDALLLKEAMYRHAVAKNPSDAWAFYELGNALREQGRQTEAIDQYRAALERDPRHAVTHNNLGVVLSERGRPGDAARHFREALRAEPDLADAHYNLGNVRRAEGELGAALEHYREAVRLEPGFAEAHNNLGEVLASRGLMQDAVAAFRRAVDVRPDWAQGHSNLGAALGQQGRLDEAIVHFRRALELDPAHAGARENLELALEVAGRR